jgi:hypothetical protein
MLLLRKLVKVRLAGVPDRDWTGLEVVCSTSCPECSTTRILSLLRDVHRGLWVSFLFRAGTRATMPAMGGR